MIFVIGLPTFLALSGFAIDYNRSVSFRASLQNAVDAASLAGARDYALNVGAPPKVRTVRALDVATRVFEAQFALITERGNFLDLDVDYAVSDDAEVTVNASGRLRTTIGAIAGVEAVDIEVDSVAVGTIERQEVALVLDNTGSMRFDIQALRDSAHGLVDALVEGTPPGVVKLAVVPFVTTVNVGADFPTQFLDTNGDSEHHGSWFEGRDVAELTSCADPPALPPGYTIRQQGGTCYVVNPDKVNHFDLFSGLTNTGWKGCVESLPEPFDVQDITPNGNPNTKFVPYFVPDTAFLEAYADDLFFGEVHEIQSRLDGRHSWLHDTNNYWPTQGPGSVRHLNRTDDNGVPPLSTAQRAEYSSANLVKYNNATVDPLDQTGLPIPPLGEPYRGNGPNATCPTQIQPLTDDFDAVRASIDRMVPWNGSGTNTQIGASWGWKVLSPSAPFTEGESPKDVRKIMVLMTDGQNELATLNRYSVVQPTVSDYSGLGFLRSSRTGATTSAELVSYVDDRLERTCQNAKNDGITIYTVIFRVPVQATIDLYRRCASSSSNAYFATSQAELQDAFRDIGQNIRSLRLTR